MTPPLRARLFYLTQPSPNVILLNLQFADGELPMRVELTQRQLASILVDGTAMALRANRVLDRCICGADDNAPVDHHDISCPAALGMGA